MVLIHNNNQLEAQHVRVEDEIAGIYKVDLPMAFKEKFQTNNLIFKQMKKHVVNHFGKKQMILKSQEKESIYKINPLLDKHEVFKVIGEYKMRFVALAADKVESPFRHKKGEQLGNAVAKTIPELWEGKQIKKEYWDMCDFKDSKVNKALKLYDELFNPEMTKRHVKRIESLEN